MFEGESLEGCFSSVDVIGKAEGTRPPHARNGNGLEIRGSPSSRISISSSLSFSITTTSTSSITIGLVGKEAMILVEESYTVLKSEREWVVRLALKKNFDG
jgi:hypothetical protein